MLSPAFMAQSEYAAFIDAFATEAEAYLRETGALR